MPIVKVSDESDYKMKPGSQAWIDTGYWNLWMDHSDPNELLISVYRSGHENEDAVDTLFLCKDEKEMSKPAATPEPEFTEFRVKWCQCPTTQNDTKILFVEAGNADDARKIAHDHIERKFGIAWFSILEVTTVKKLPPGRVKE